MGRFREVPLQRGRRNGNLDWADGPGAFLGAFTLAKSGVSGDLSLLARTIAQVSAQSARHRRSVRVAVLRVICAAPAHSGCSVTLATGSRLAAWQC
jgi:hypothetical protein